MRSMAAGRFKLPGRSIRDGGFARVDSLACNEDNAVDALLVLLGTLRSSAPSSPTSDCDFCIACVFSLSMASSSSSEMSESSGRDACLLWLGSPNPNTEGFSKVLDVAVEGAVSTFCVSVSVRPRSPSLNAFTLIGASVGTTADDAIALAMGWIEGLLEDADLVVAGVDMRDVLEDFIACDWLSEEWPAKDEAVVGDCSWEEAAES